MKVCLREEGDLRNVVNGRVEFTQREIRILASAALTSIALRVGRS